MQNSTRVRNPGRRKLQRGTAVIEFALSWALMSLMFTGVYQFGYTFYIYNAMLVSTTGAAELASTYSYDTGDTSAYTTAITNMVLYGDTVAGTNPIVPGLTAANVSVSISFNNSIPTDVTVSIASYTVDTFFKTFTFTGKPRVTVAYLGRVTCSTC